MRDGLVEDVEEEARKGPEEGLNLSWRTTRKSGLKHSGIHHAHSLALT